MLVEGTLDRPGNNSSKWRLACNDHDKAHLLFMRFSTTGERTNTWSMGKTSWQFAKLLLEYIIYAVKNEECNN